VDIRRIPRAAIDGSLRLARVPVDLVTGVLPNAEPVGLAVDRADAGVRDALGRVLRDEQLQDEAERRRIAADERERALRLRAEAELKEERAKAERRESEREADQRKRNAAKDAEKAEQRVEEQRDEKVRQLDEAERKRKQSVRKTAEAVEESIDSQAKRARLAELEEEAEVLGEHDDALRAKSEATRLADAASRAKAQRKSG
jgi:dTMP kinase